MEVKKGVFIALFVTLFLVVFNYTLALMAGIYIVGDLGGSSYTSTYATSFYSVGNALGVPLGRSLSPRFGAVRVLFVCLFLFAFTSFLCGISPNFPFFIVARFLQGLVSGPFYTLVFRLFSELTPAKKKILFTSITLTIFTVSPVLGASFGGWIAYDYDWRSLFYLNIPLIVATALYIWSKLKNYRPFLPKKPFDGWGYFFYFFAVLAISFALIMGQELDWFRSSLITSTLCFGLLFFIFLIFWSLHHSDPVVNFRLLKHPIFSFALVNLALLFSTYFGTVILLALWLSLYVNYTPIWIGVLLGGMALSGLFPAYLIRSKLGERDARWPLIIAILFIAISSFNTMEFNVEIDFERIAISRLLAGFGLAFFLPPIFRLCFHTFEEEKTLDVVVIFQFVRALSSGLGAALFTTLWQRRQVFYHERLGSQLTPFSQPTQDFLTQSRNLGLQGSSSFAQLDYFLDRQATALALDDCFYFMGWIMVALGVILLLSYCKKKESFCVK